MNDEHFDPDLLITETENGRLEGAYARGAYRFKGIPYAAPPIGERRFAPPAPPKGWSGLRSATGDFPVAPQPPDMTSQLVGAGDGPATSEADCLTLNVWTPAPDDGRRPVMVWIHGGAFVNGSGSIPWYDGANLTRRDVVVVTVNYRLGVLGFCHLSDLAGPAYAGSGNVGLLDQAAALSWVHDNIAAFGGDPDNVTIFGESAGGMSVGCHLALESSRGLFHHAIAQSGAIDNVSTPDHATGIATRILTDLGLERHDVDRLRSVPVAALLAAQEKVSAASGIAGGLPFQPVADGVDLPENPIGAVRDGCATGIDLLIGSNRDEMRLFLMMAPALEPADDAVTIRRLEQLAPGHAEAILAAYRRLQPDATAADLFEAISTDAVFRLPALRLADAQATHAPVHVYEFHQPSTGFGGALGAAHAVDVPYVFDNLDAPGAAVFVGDADAGTRQLATDVADAWCSFARRGDPNASGLPDWPRWDAPRHTTMMISTDARLIDAPAGEVRAAWDMIG